VEVDQLGASQPGGHQREEDEPVSLNDAGVAAQRPTGRLEHPPELGRCQPLTLVTRLARRLQVEEGIGYALATAEPAHKPPQDEEAPVIGSRGGRDALPVIVEVIDDRAFLEQVSTAAGTLRPAEQVGDGVAISAQRALAPSTAPQPT